jgi:hypothetical protein
MPSTVKVTMPPRGWSPSSRTSRVWADLVLDRGGPGRRVKVEERWLELVEDIDRHLPHRLAGVEQ